MPDNPDAKKEENSQLFKDIHIPSIPKQTAGAVAGAAVAAWRDRLALLSAEW